MADRPRDEPGNLDPDELLDRYQLRDDMTAVGEAGEAARAAMASGDSHAPRRGKLRIYLGMAAGVGKTYAMLNEGQRRRSRGTDVVIGYVDTHGRALTEAQIDGLEIIPRQRITYHGREFEEMDTAAVVRRHPQVALVDELAHSNVPGARYAKRHQDVEDLLDSEITVITTLNIQHLQGLNDLVEAITGVRQRETVPDAVLDEADDVEMVDIAPEALRARMRHGHVYPPDQARQALERYFTPSNLAALRELALKRVAEKTEHQLERYLQASSGAATKQTAVAERVMVAFDERASAAQLLRHGWRLARGLGAPLLAVTVTRPGGGRARNDPAAQAQLARNIRLAEDLGANVIREEARAVAAALARVARERHITEIVVGQPEASRWRELVGESVVNRLLRLPTGAAVHVVPTRQVAADAGGQR